MVDWLEVATAVHVAAGITSDNSQVHRIEEVRVWRGSPHLDLLPHLGEVVAAVSLQPSSLITIGLPGVRLHKTMKIPI